jgi:hypothetical protein
MGKKFDYQKQNRFLEELVRIYSRQDASFKKKVNEEDFVLAFTVIEINGEASSPKEPEEFELDPLIFAAVEKAFEKIYRL